MRLRRFPSVAPRRDGSLCLPSVAPKAAEVESWAASFAPARQLKLPIELLGSASARSASCRGFKLRVLGFDLPRGSLIRINEETAIVSPELLLLQMARAATPLELFLLVCELCGTYAIQPAVGEGLIQREGALTDLAAIDGFLESVGSVPGSAALRKACGRSF